MEVLFGLIDIKLKQALPLEKVNVDVRVSGTTASISSELHYNNKSEQPVEVVYVFPMEDKVSVCGFQIKIEDRIIKGKVEDKEKARDIYDDAVSSGKSAFLLEENTDSSDIFRISVGNLPGKTIATVQIQCVVTLKSSKDGSLTFSLPTVLNPRYCPDSQIDKDDTWTAKLHRAPFVKLPYNFSFDMQVEMGSDIEKIYSETDKLKVVIDNSNKRKAFVNLDGDFQFNHDIEVVMVQNSPFIAYVFTEKGKQGVIDQKKGKASWEQSFPNVPVVMLNFLPKFSGKSLPDSKDTTTEFIFVIDRSGSMAGRKIENAREALLLFLKSLPVGCYFDVISFGSSFNSFFGKSEKYSDTNLRNACSFVKGIQADMGGTEILNPLDYVYKRNGERGSFIHKFIYDDLSAEEKLEQNVFLLTDGEVSNTQQVINLVKANSSGSRCFALGIGHGASTSLVNGVAKAGRGVADFVRSDERLQKKVISMLGKACKARAENIRVEWNVPSSITVKQIPEYIDFIFDEEFLMVYGVLTGNNSDELKGNVTLKYELAGKNYSEKLKFDVENNVSEEVKHFSLHALVAKDYIKQSSQFGHEVNATLKDTITQLSKASGVMSKYTSYVAVDESTQVPIQGPLTYYDVNDSLIEFDPFGPSQPMAFGAPYSGSYQSNSWSGFNFGAMRPKCGNLSSGQATFSAMPLSAPPPPSNAATFSAMSPNAATFSAIPPPPMGGYYASNAVKRSAIPSNAASFSAIPPPPPMGGYCASNAVASSAMPSNAAAFSAIPPLQAQFSQLSTNLMDSYDSTTVNHYSCKGESYSDDLLSLGLPPPLTANNPISKTGCRASVPSHLSLVNLQSASGNWVLTTEFSSELGKKHQNLISSCPTCLALVPLSNDEKMSIWATVLAVCWLTSNRFETVQDELFMIIEKAEKWLSDRLPASVTRDQLTQEAKAALS